MAYRLNVPLHTAIGRGDGSDSSEVLPGNLSMIKVDCPNVVIDTVKKAEDSGAIVVRMYECYNRRSKVNLTFFRDLEEVIECDLMEKPLAEIPLKGSSFSFEIRPYEIRTFLLKVKK